MAKPAFRFIDSSRIDPDKAPAPRKAKRKGSKRKGVAAIGSGAAGIPFLLVGQNQRIVWGATRNPADVTDVYQEQVVPDPASPSGLSTVYQERIEPIIPRPQVFRYNRIADGVPDNLATAEPGDTVNGTFIPPAVLIVPRRNQSTSGVTSGVRSPAGSRLAITHFGDACLHDPFS